MWVYTTYKGDRKKVTEEYVLQFIRNVQPDSNTRLIKEILRMMRESNKAFCTLQGKIKWQDTYSIVG